MPAVVSAGMANRPRRAPRRRTRHGEERLVPRCFSYAVCLDAGVGSMIHDHGACDAACVERCGLCVAERCCRPSRPCL